MDAPSATGIPEAELVRWLIGDSPGVRILAAEIGLQSEALALFQTPTDDVCPGATAPGDIDLLIVPNDDRAETIAFECKRVLIPPLAFDTGLPGKLNDLKKGVRQANALARLGFSQTYLLVAMVTDARGQSGEFWWSGPTPDLVRVIDDHSAFRGLEPGVGLVIVEATQSVDREIHMSGHIGVRVERKPAVREQAVDLTQRIARYIDACRSGGVRSTR
ncbi:MAG TPA: hypothetical protein VFJ82_04745 [Longimicrobium sp.]|nr:hypothetical protein [Longimicrobium sp.]